jgi:hypothetical protein
MLLFLGNGTRANNADIFHGAAGHFEELHGDVLPLAVWF